MKGCLLVGGGLLLIVVLIGLIGSAMSSSFSNSGSSSSSSADFNPPAKSIKHGWVTHPKLGSSIDFWDSPDLECRGVEIAAQRIVDAQNSGDTPNADNIPGRRDLASGVRVDVLGHDSSLCHGSTMPLTKVEVVDQQSSLNGQVGYITEGLLSRQ
jgi:hypothetical protein